MKRISNGPGFGGTAPELSKPIDLGTIFVNDRIAHRASPLEYEVTTFETGKKGILVSFNTARCTAKYEMHDDALMSACSHPLIGEFDKKALRMALHYLRVSHRPTV